MFSKKSWIAVIGVLNFVFFFAGEVISQPQLLFDPELGIYQERVSGIGSEIGVGVDVDVDAPLNALCKVNNF